MLELQIQQHFIDSADLKYQLAPQLSRPIATAVQALLTCMTSGGKVLACASGACGALAQQFCAEFMGRFERERPALAAWALSADSAVQAALIDEFASTDLYARQVQALGQAGDVLLVLCAHGHAPRLMAALAAAHEREMTVLALLGGLQPGPLAQQLRETDVLVHVPYERSARVREVHQLILHCLCDAVDSQLLGEQEFAL